MTRRLTAFGLLAVSLAGFTLPLEAQGVKTAPPTRASSPFSPFTLNNAENIEFVQNRRTGKTDAVLQGNGLIITTPRYDLAAPRITMSASDGAVQEAIANGGVRVEVRSPRDLKDGRSVTDTTTLTGDKATYFARSGATPAHIDVTGNVRSVLRSAEFAPLITTCTSATIEFLDADQTRTRLKGVTATGTLLDQPTPKKKP